MSGGAGFVLVVLFVCMVGVLWGLIASADNHAYKSNLLKNAPVQSRILGLANMQVEAPEGQDVLPIPYKNVSAIITSTLRDRADELELEQRILAEQRWEPKAGGGIQLGGSELRVVASPYMPPDTMLMMTPDTAAYFRDGAITTNLSGALTAPTVKDDQYLGTSSNTWGEVLNDAMIAFADSMDLYILNTSREPMSVRLPLTVGNVTLDVTITESVTAASLLAVAEFRWQGGSRLVRALELCDVVASIGRTGIIDQLRSSASLIIGVDLSMASRPAVRGQTTLAPAARAIPNPGKVSLPGPMSIGRHTVTKYNSEQYIDNVMNDVCVVAWFTCRDKEFKADAKISSWDLNRNGNGTALLYETLSKNIIAMLDAEFPNDETSNRFRELDL